MSRLKGMSNANRHLRVHLFALFLSTECSYYFCFETSSPAAGSWEAVTVCLCFPGAKGLQQRVLEDASGCALSSSARAFEESVGG